MAARIRLLLVDETDVELSGGLLLSKLSPGQLGMGALSVLKMFSISSLALPGSEFT